MMNVHNHTAIGQLIVLRLKYRKKCSICHIQMKDTAIK